MRAPLPAFFFPFTKTQALFDMQGVKIKAGLAFPRL
jgi:hypothetical protein